MKKIILLIGLTIGLFSQTFNVSTNEEMVAALDTSLTNGVDDTIVIFEDIFLSNSYVYIGSSKESLTIQSSGTTLKQIMRFTTTSDNNSTINFNNVHLINTNSPAVYSPENPIALYCNDGKIHSSQLQKVSIFSGNIIIH